MRCNIHTFLVSIFTICLLLLDGDSTLAQDSLSFKTTQTNVTDQIDNYSIYIKNNQLTFQSNNVKSGDLVELTVNGEPKSIDISDNKVVLKNSFFGEGLNFVNLNGNQQLYHLRATDGNIRLRHLPLWLSILPPFIAILLALLFKEVIISLIIGIWTGAFIAAGLDFRALITSIYRVVDKYLIESLSDAGHLAVIVFSLLIGAMVALISKNGGMMGVVESLSNFAKDRKSTQRTTWFLGVAIFFDDYANTLIVGNTMRSVTDKYRISREKLAYIVDSTAAPVSAIAFVTTWIGAELGYIGDGLEKLGLASELTPYSVFVQSLKYSFYPILTLIFVYLLIRSGRDFSNMYKAEYRAITKGQVSPAKTEAEDEPDMEDLSPVPGAPRKWWFAAFPIVTVIAVTLIGLLITGFDSVHSELLELNNSVNSNWGAIWGAMNGLFEQGQAGFFTKLGKIIGASDSYAALLWASSSGLIVALAITLGSRTMKLMDSMHWVTTGIKTMLPAIIILILAWSLAITTDELHTADFITHALKDSIHPFVIPGVIFILAAAIAFSTGSSWSTMAILYPIAIPASFAICQASGYSPEMSMEILLCVISTVLSASVLGDHISPISDTTILSSLASDCNHIDHVKTQIPYALVVGLFSLVFMTIAIILGGGWLISLICMGFAVIGLYFVIRIFGKVLPEIPSE